MTERPPLLHDLLTKPLPAGRAGRFVEGLKAVAWGWRLMRLKPSLWRFAIAPIVLNMLITLLTLGVLIALGVWFFSATHEWFHRDWGAWTWWVGYLMEIGAGLMALIFSFGFALVLWMILSSVLCGYFYGRLAEEAEVALGKPRGALKSISIPYEAIDTLRSVGELIVFNLGFFLIGFVPVVGPPTALAGSTYWNAAIFGYDFLSYPLSLQGLRRTARQKYCRGNRAASLGLGMTVMTLQFIPLLGAVPLATAAAGAVVLVRRLEYEKEQAALANMVPATAAE